MSQFFTSDGQSMGASAYVARLEFPPETGLILRCGETQRKPEVPASPRGEALFRCALSRVQLFRTSWTVAHQAPLSMDFPGKNTGVGCHFLLQQGDQTSQF